MKQVRLFLNENKWFYLLLTFSLTLPFSQFPSPPPQKKNTMPPTTILSLLKTSKTVFEWKQNSQLFLPPSKPYRSIFKKIGRGPKDILSTNPSTPEVTTIPPQPKYQNNNITNIPMKMPKIFRSYWIHTY